MELPSRLKVGHIWYTVNEMKASDHDFRLYKGTHIGDTYEIKVSMANENWPDVAETLLHEAFHGFRQKYCWQAENGEDEERETERAAVMVCQLFADNPDLYKFVGDALGISASPAPSGITERSLTQGGE